MLEICPFKKVRDSKNYILTDFLVIMMAKLASQCD